MLLCVELIRILMTAFRGRESGGIQLIIIPWIIYGYIYHLNDGNVYKWMNWTADRTSIYFMCDVVNCSLSSPVTSYDFM